MTTRTAARALVDAFITNDDLPEGDVAIVLDDETIEKPWGWVFFYNSRRFVETGDVLSCLGGNAPLIVERTSGRLLETGTAQDIGFYLSNYEATGDPHMQPGRVLELSSCNPGANRIEAARLIAKSNHHFHRGCQARYRRSRPRPFLQIGCGLRRYRIFAV